MPLGSEGFRLSGSPSRGRDVTFSEISDVHIDDKALALHALHIRPGAGLVFMVVGGRGP